MLSLTQLLATGKIATWDRQTLIVVMCSACTPHGKLRYWVQWTSENVSDLQGDIVCVMRLIITSLPGRSYLICLH